MKDKAGGVLVTFYVGLRSKMFIFLIKEEKEEKCVKKAKGIKHSIVRNKISFQDYIHYKEKVVNLFSVEQNKVNTPKSLLYKYNSDKLF